MFDSGFTYSSSSGIFTDLLFNGIRLYDPAALAPAFTSARIVGSTGVPVDAWRLTYDADNIYLNVAGLPNAGGGPFSITVAVSTVPEPSTLALVGGSLAAIGLIRLGRTRRRRTS